MSLRPVAPGKNSVLVDIPFAKRLNSGSFYSKNKSGYWRPMPSHYDKYFAASVETLPREEIERLQEARIPQLVPYVHTRAPLTRHIWDQAGVHPDDIKSLQDYKDK